MSLSTKVLLLLVFLWVFGLLSSFSSIRSNPN